MEDILNHIQINELIATSGQPTATQFNKIKDEGYEAVINLALSTSDNALENEDKLVTSLGMSYFHIPVSFEEPKLSDLKLFVNILQSLGANKVWVHCAMNYRVTAFMYVYHKFVLKTPFEYVDLSMFEQWSPDTVWQNIMKTEYEALYKA